MPKKKKESIAPEEPLTENQEGQTVPAESGEMEGGGFPSEAENTAPLPEEESTLLPAETEAGDFPPEAGAADFPPGEDPFPDGGAVGNGKNPAGEEPTPVEPVGGAVDVSLDGDIPAEGVPSAGEAGLGEGVPPAETDPEYGTLLHEWSEANGAQPEECEGGDDPLVLDPPSGMEPEPFPEPEGSVESVEEAAADDAVDVPSKATGTRRRRTANEVAAARRSAERERVLTIEARDEVQTDDDREAAIWHEIQNADWTRRILTGTLDGVEQTESGLTLAIVSYKGFRVAIPIKEMLLYPGKLPTGPEYLDTMNRLRRILMTRLGSEIDFVVKGHDNKSRSAVGSRKDAMYRKRQSFYLDKDELGEPMIYEGRIVQARVVAVAEKIIRVEVFGVECAIVARGLSRSWMGDATEKFSVGDRILVRVLKISGNTVEDLAITVDVRSVFKDGGQDNLKKCVPQGRYAGRVTDVRGGMAFIRLNNGVNAIAHSCYDRRTPGKRDDVSFSVTRLDPEQGVAIGIITRIIKQNL